MSVGADYPAVLVLMLLGIIPLVARGEPGLAYSTFTLLPRDRLSRLLSLALRLLRCAVILLIVAGISGPFVHEQEVERIGEGAQIVLLLDRSRSMDQPFGSRAAGNPIASAGTEPKGAVARRLLTRFVADRRNDKYGMLVFSTEPIPVLPLTDKPAIIRAAIEAGDIGRGLSETDVGAGLVAAIRNFEGQPFTGSRVVLLISDGGARLDLATRGYIADMLERNRVSLYWIYIRSRYSPGVEAPNAGELREDIAPARVLHEYFSSLATPYRLFDAEDPGALAAAIEEVNRLQSLPIRYVDVLPRRAVSGWCYAAAMLLLGLLLVAESREVRRW